MSINPCSKCGKLFRMVNSSVCPECSSRKDSGFENIKEYLYSHPNSTITEIAEGTGVDESEVLDFINTGRLIAKGEGAHGCEICGRTLPSNRRICANCSKV
ncbi:MAG: hypothetical protein CVV64_00905 [Candidatus Wallbacteria bacterium HGW-Wallbacteria-1]|jgi:uncharacterized OB-fold protein|uniref:MerR family transcriptional regulator n=1 Tax=Candidatus Wallbacteria bacterium HGW-Wallbacteria-1 TaxID=2013854 RepID=A0A2N1PUM1_9BACT|nr:MAG: hypothetical protein CVV64_00905 [Candidatus Wallbacteria bacterium HGW-Wallbacteria-1]